MLKKLLLVGLLMCIGSVGWAAQTYDAAVNINTEDKIIIGTINITTEEKAEISLRTAGLKSLTVNGGSVPIKNGVISIDLEKGVTKTIVYEKEISENDTVTEDFISIAEFMPSIRGGSAPKYNISVTMANEFEAITSAESVKKVKKTGGTEFIFTMTKPVETFDLIASSKYVVTTGKAGDTEVALYLFKEDKDLGSKYMANTIKYIKQYEEIFGDFPYKRFAVVEHIHPYGYATPTYTVLGSSVIRLPFIPTTSLGHEIIHQWFGSAITGKGKGNWFEAITAYYSDMMNLPTIEEQNEYRKNIMATYENYLKDDVEYPLSDFMYNDSKLSQSVGYGKGSMVFHMLNMEVGSENFQAGIKDFVNKYKYKSASWDDIFNSFKGDGLREFSHYWLNRSDIPEISVSSSSFMIEQAKPVIRFTLTRKGGTEEMLIPYTVFYNEGKDEGVVLSKKGEQVINIPVKDMQATLVIDYDYDIMRKLSPLEKPASITGILASDDILGVKGIKGDCSKLFEAFKVTDIKEYKDVTIADFTDKDLIVCGFDNPAVQMVANDIKADMKATSEYLVISNPNSLGRYIMVAQDPTPENIRLLSHYGKYSYLKFSGSKNIEKNVDNTSNGIDVSEYIGDRAVETRAARTLDDVIRVARLYPAIFVGESHDNYAHHLNQLEIIKRLHKDNVKVAVGFEMIQKQFQGVLNDFIEGDITESEFVEGVEYHDRWGFDYNLYAPLFRYLRDNKIPGIALNIETSIIKKVSSGKLSELTEEEVKQFPKAMKLTNKNYEKEIRKIFAMHPAKEGVEKAFSDFFLAQNIWDETMADSVVRFQEKNPSYTVVVIAGSGHMDKNSGIPYRYERITGKRGFVIAQDGELDEEKSDIVFSTVPISSDGTPKIGVTLNMEGNNPKVEKVDKGSPAHVAGIKGGDILLACGDKLLGKNIGTLRYALFEVGYGNEIDCIFQRDGVKMETTIPLFLYKQDKDDKFHDFSKMMKSMQEKQEMQEEKDTKDK